MGLGAAIWSLLGARWVSYGRGTPLQLFALFGALGLQAILLVAAARTLGPMSEDRLWFDGILKITVGTWMFLTKREHAV